MAKSHTLIILFIAAVSFTHLPTPVVAQDSENDQATIARLQQEVEILKQKVDLLSKRLAELRAMVERQPASTAAHPAAPLPRRSPSRTPNPLLPPAPRDAADILGEPANPDIATAPTDAPPIAPPTPTDRPKYTAVQDILTDLPSDAQPDKQLGWDSSRIEKARKWFADNVVGKRIATRVTVFDSRVALRRPNPNDPDDTPQYRIEFELQPNRFRLFDMSHEGRFRTDAGLPLSITVDPIIARNATRAFRPGQELPLVGTIKSVTLPLATSTRTLIDIRLGDYELANFEQ